jgi:uncharacterized protein
MLHLADHGLPMSLCPTRDFRFEDLYWKAGRRISDRNGILSIPMRFEFDPAKSTANKAKHGIDFVDGRALWTDPDRVETPARSLDEPRYQVIGRIGEKTWSAFVTYRNETIRIISIRHARPEEEARYLAD